MPETSLLYDQHAAARFYPFSYDIGHGKRISSAYNARTYLTALRFAPKIKQCLDWNYMQRYNIGTQWYLRGLSHVPSVLGNLIGNSVFVQDIEIGQDYRCYIFENEKTALAAVWSYNFKIDNAEKEAPVLKMTYDNFRMNLFNMMGTLCVPDIKENVFSLQVGSFPFFIKVLKNDKQALVAMLQSVKGTVKKTIAFKGEFNRKGLYSISAINASSEIRKGTFSVSSFAGNNPVKEITLPQKQKETINLDISSLIAKQYFNLPLKISFKEKEIYNVEKNIILFFAAELKSKPQLVSPFSSPPPGLLKKGSRT